MCRGSSLWCSSFGLVVCALCSWFCLGCVEPLPLPKGSEPCPLQSDLALCLSLAFDRLLKFLFISFFYFSFLSGYQILCVVNALIKGEIEDHVWSEDRWRSLPGVMSD
jgi:hypothetical protein